MIKLTSQWPKRCAVDVLVSNKEKNIFCFRIAAKQKLGKHIEDCLCNSTRTKMMLLVRPQAACIVVCSTLDFKSANFSHLLNRC